MKEKVEVSNAVLVHQLLIEIVKEKWFLLLLSVVKE